MRRADIADIVAIARLYMVSRRALMPFAPTLHSEEEDIAFFTGCLEHRQATVAEREGKLLGFAFERPGCIHHLFLDPAEIDRGLGTMLMDEVKSRQDAIELWVFQQNTRARAFYERQGFWQVRETAGDNEEGLPDVLYAWRRQSAASVRLSAAL